MTAEEEQAVQEQQPQQEQPVQPVHVSSIQAVPLYNPRTMPCKGMYSYPSPMSIPDGSFSLVQNADIGSMEVVCRQAFTEISQSYGDGLRTSVNIGGAPAATGAGTTPMVTEKQYWATYTAKGYDWTCFRGACLWNGTWYAAYKHSSSSATPPFGACVDIFRSADIYYPSSTSVAGTSISGWARLTGYSNGNQGSSSAWPQWGPFNEASAGTNNSMGDTHERVVFTPVKAPYSRDANGKITGETEVLVASNGGMIAEPEYVKQQFPATQWDDYKSVPLVIWSDGAIGVHRRIDPPKYVSSAKSRVSFSNYAFIGQGPTASYAYTTINGTTPQTAFGSATTVLSELSGQTNVTGAIAATELTSGGYTCIMKFDVGGESVPIPLCMDLRNKRQVIIVTDTSEFGEFWDSVAFGIVDNQNRKLLLSSMDTEPEVVGFQGYVAINLQGVSEPRKCMYEMRGFTIRSDIDLDGFDLSAVNGFFFTWLKNEAFNARKVMHVAGFYASGDMPGLTQYAVSWHNYYAQSESQAVVVPLGGGEAMSSLGWHDDAVIPEHDSFYYRVRLPVPVPNSNALKWGVRSILVYAKPNGMAEFSAIGGKGGYIDLTVNLGTTLAAPYSTRYNLMADGSSVSYAWLNDYSIDMKRVAVLDGHMCMPGHTSAVAANNRMYVADGDSLYISEVGNPFRYRSYPKIVDGMLDPAAGTTKKFDGEKVMALAAVSSSVIGANQIYVATDKSLCVVDSSDMSAPASYVGPLGTVSKGAMASFQGRVYTLDSQRQVRLYVNGGIGNPSKGSVEDWFASPVNGRGVAPKNLSRVQMLADGDKVYVACAQGDAEHNNTILVYDTRVDAWTVYAGFPSEFDVAQMAVWEDPYTKRRRFIVFGSYGRIFEMGAPGTLKDSAGESATSNVIVARDINVKLTTQEYHVNAWERMRFGRLGVLCDSLPGGTMMISREMKCGDSGRPTPMKLYGYGKTWRWSPSEAGYASYGVSGKWTVEVNAEAGWRLYSLVGEMERSMAGGPD